jgi:hypothetical protein
MSVHSIVLVFQVTAVLALCAALSVEVLSLVYLRGASTLAEASPWIEPVPRLPLLAVGSVLVILLSGVYLVLPISASGQSWPKEAITALLLMGPLGAIRTKRMRAIRKACRIEKASNSELLGRLRDPFLKIARRSNRSLSRNFSARECQTRPVGVDQPYGSLFNGRSPFIASRLAPKYSLVARALWDIDASLSGGRE